MKKETIEKAETLLARIKKLKEYKKLEYRNDISIRFLIVWDYKDDRAERGVQYNSQDTTLAAFTPHVNEKVNEILEDTFERIQKVYDKEIAKLEKEFDNLKDM